MRQSKSTAEETLLEIRDKLKDINSNKKGIGTMPLIFLILATLKISGAVTFSWWYVTMPLWLPTLIVLGVLLIGIVLVMIALIVSATIESEIDKK